MTVGSIEPYLSLITSEHADKPNFNAVMSLLLQPLADIKAQILALPGLFDLDVAVGQQLDFVGQWVGVSRYLQVPITDVYFSFDTVGLGFDEGTWWAPPAPLTQLDILPDDAYRTLLRARIASNNWDGTVPGAYSVWNILFAGTGYTIQITDNQDMTIDYNLVGPTPDALTLALYEGGYLSLKPAGVEITSYKVNGV